MSSKPEKALRRQLRELTPLDTDSVIADRMTLLNAAAAWMKANGPGEYDIMDVLAVAEFMAGTE